MRRRMYVWVGVFILLGGFLLVAVSTGAMSWSSNETKGAKITPRHTDHTVKITPWGPTQETIDGAKAYLMKHPSVQKYLQGTSHRLLHFELLDPEVKNVARSEAPDSYRATIYDYTNNRAVIVNGRLNNPGLEVSLSKAQPNPSEEEFNDAVSVVTKDPDLGPKIHDRLLAPYAPMPPLATIESGKDNPDRVVTVGLMPKDGGDSNEIVGVNMVRQTIIRYLGGAPATSDAIAANCGVASAGQGSTARGTAGQAEIVISRGTTEIWRFIVIRPSASSGQNASGIELRDVNFRGKRLLTRANAPILNVQYERNTCGPFRDWSWQEGNFAAEGTDVVAGIRMCTSEPSTVIESGVDAGNFRGVAVYDRDGEVLLMSELNAGWYRYISLWVFRDDGIIQPRFGFGATASSCVCRIHTHHVYWRFDFDVNTAENNSILETGLGLPTNHEVEIMRLRQFGSRRQQWLVQNSNTNDSVAIIPRILDGNTDKYGQGDVWLLRLKTNAANQVIEIDDSANPGGSEARLNPFVNGESIAKQDIVVWYGAHWNHDNFDLNSLYQGPNPTHGGGPFYNGPDIVIRSW